MSTGDDDRTLTTIQRGQRGQTLHDGCDSCTTSGLYCQAHQWFRQQPCCTTCSHQN